MKKLFGNPVFAVIFSLALICASTVFSARLKAGNLSADAFACYAAQFPGNILLR